MNKLAISTIALSTLLSGCSWLTDNAIYGDDGIIRDRSQDYEQAQVTERLVIPPHLRPKNTEDTLQVPDVGSVATARTSKFKVPRPEFFYAESGSESVSLQRADGEKFIIVDENVTNVWVKLQEFWQFNGIELTKSDPQNGVMETQWIVQEGKKFSFIDTWVKRLTFQDIQGDSKDKLRVSLSPVAGDPGRTSVAMQHVRFAAKDEVTAIDWQNQSRDVSFKSDMMFEMLRYLGKASGDRSAQTLIAFQEKRRKATQLGRDSEGNTVLKINTDIDVAWDEISTALDQADFDVGTRDRETGLFYMTYTTTTPFENTEELGFFEWLHSDRGDITFDTSAITSALGLNAEEGDEGVSYTSGKTAEYFASKEQDGADDELNDPTDDANKKGYKIWFAGKPIYVFGGDDTGIFNANSGKFEHTGQYQLKLQRTRSGIFLSVLTNEAVSAPDIIAEELLWTIKENLPRS